MKRTLCAVVAVVLSLFAKDVTAMTKKEADKLMADGNCAEAYAAYTNLVLDAKNGMGEKERASCLAPAVICLQDLGRSGEGTYFLGRAKEAWPKSFYIGLEVLKIKWCNLSHYGAVIRGKYVNMYSWGRGASSMEKDRVESLRSLLKMNGSLGGIDEDTCLIYWELFYKILMCNDRGMWASWKLQELTDLSKDAEIEEDYEFFTFERGDAPVDEDGNPVFYEIPESFEKAKNDGERMRWVLRQMAAVSDSGASSADRLMGEFSYEQFAVKKLGSLDPELLSLQTLEDDETFTKLANGPKRFKLPPAYDYIALWKARSDWYSIGNEYLDRLQYDKAAEAFKKDGSDTAREKRDQIVNPWLRVDGEPYHTYASAPSFNIVFRNATEVSVKMQLVDEDKVLASIKKKAKSKSKDIRWYDLNFEDLATRFAEGEGTEFLTKETVEWKEPLSPREKHFDTRATLTAPSNVKPGRYYVTFTAKDGNSAHMIANIPAMAIVSLGAGNDEAADYALVDAETGAPVPGAKVELFAFGQSQKDYHKFEFRELNLSSGENGIISVPALSKKEKNLVYGYESGFLAARTADGKIAVIGMGRYRSYWGGGDRISAEANKTIVITDRPVYRPGDTVHFKAWAMKRSYDDKIRSYFADKDCTVKIVNPKSENVYSAKVKLDRFGGVSGEFKIPEDATLGRYPLFLEGAGLYRWDQSGYFRVEEYKKPEYEVSVDAPQKPLALGEKATATIRAKYFFGAPVTKGTAKITVRRRTVEQDWMPFFRWDWLYGRGCSWYFYDCDWYDGLLIGRPCYEWMSWWRATPPPEEIVKITAPLNEDGTVKVSWDTEVAKLLYGVKDQEYSISVEVTDESRRTITGGGKVIVAAEPFRVYTWTDRPSYNLGDKITAHSRVASADGRAVSAKAEWKLFRLTYDAEGKQHEEKVDLGAVKTALGADEEFVMSATTNGQFRLVCAATDADGVSREGSRIITVRGKGDDGRAYRYASLELVPDRETYAPGDIVTLAVNTERKDSTVFISVRPDGGLVGNASGKPGKRAFEVLRVDGKCGEIKIPVVTDDQPNFFVDAWTVSAGDIHHEVREILVPPVTKVGNVEVVAVKGEVKPGEEAEVTVRVTDENGKPCDASGVISVYDKAIDAVAGGSNVPDMKNTFWNWKRNFRPSVETSFLHGWMFYLKEDFRMEYLGAFGRQIANMEGPIALGGANGMKLNGVMQRSGAGRIGGVAKCAAPAAMAVEDGIACCEAAPACDENDAEEDEGAAVAVRTEFSDTAYWNAALEETGTAGVYTVKFKMPEDITGWRTRVWTMGQNGRVAEGETEIVTRKDLMLRFQAPRFFVERDEVVLSANVHNYKADKRESTVKLSLSGAPVELLSPASVKLKPSEEERVDWRVKILGEGELTVRMTVTDGTDSDGVEKKFPVRAHGIEKVESFSRLLRQGEMKVGKFNGSEGLALIKQLGIKLPADVAEKDIAFDVEVSDTLSEAVFGALPYLKNFEYECSEQTMNRFMPAAFARALEKPYGKEALFDELGVDDIIKKCLKRLKDIQLSNGGWGWFYGAYESASEHSTATVLRGLISAKNAGVDVSQKMIDRAAEYLQGEQKKQIKWIAEDRDHRKAYAQDAFTAYTLVLAGKCDKKMLDYLYEDRKDLPFYAKAMLGLAFAELKDTERRDMLVRNCRQYLATDGENQTSYFNLGNSGYWWYWYGSDIEAQSYGLKLLLQVDPMGSEARGVARYLYNHRRYRTHWNSTRDTGLAIEALTEYCLKAELGQKKSGDAPLFVCAYMTYFTKAEPITAAGLEIKINRTVSRITEETRNTTGRGGRGQIVDQKRTKEVREILEDGAVVKSGDVLEISLDFESKNNYEYIVIEDPKAAGCETLQNKSGYTDCGGAYPYVEFRDKHVALFLREVGRGTVSLTYRVRAEIPGVFHALPAQAKAMYAPELRANSDEFRLGVED